MKLRDGVTPVIKKIRDGTYKYKKDLRDLRDIGNKTWTSMRDGMRSVATTAAGLAAALAGISGAAATVEMGISAASELENYRLTLETVMKDTKKAGEIMRWASQFANITPFDTDEVVEATVRLQSYGISAVKHLRRIGDMAAVMNKPLMQAVEAIADAQTGELERMKEFGITKAMIDAQANKMGLNPINNKGQIVNQAAFNEALFALMEERFAGGMERQAQTFKGMMSTISGTWRMGLAEMMGVTAEGEVRVGSLFDKMKSAADGVRQAIEQMAADGTFQRIGDRIGNIITTITSGVETAFKTIRETWPKISPILYGVVGSLVAYKVAVYGAKVANVVKTASLKTMVWWTNFYGTAAQKTGGKVRLLTLIQHGFNAAMRANPIGTVITLLGLLVTAGIYVVKNWEQIKLTGMKVWNVVVDAAEWGVNKFIDGANIMLRSFRYVWDWIEYGGQLLWNCIVSGAEWGVNKLVDGANLLLRSFRYVWDWIEYGGRILWNGIISAAESGVNGLIGLVERMIDRALDGINWLIRKANKAAKELGLKINLDEITFSGLDRVDFSGALAQAVRPTWDDNYSPLSHLDFSGAKFTEDQILAQAQKAQQKSQKKQEEKSKTEEMLIDALMENTEAVTQNTSATKENSAKLVGNKSAVDIADTLVARIERHLWATT